MFSSDSVQGNHPPQQTPDVLAGDAASALDCKSPLSFDVITKQVLLRIREQISKTIRPSWQASLPSNFGSPEHGKLKGDQWRTALEFDIPVSLVQLLADNDSSSRSSIEYNAYLLKFVENTMNLSTAIAWGMSRRTSESHAQRYDFYMQRYLAGVQELYPDYNLKPIHHYSLHIPDILRLFGPLHGTWAFLPERVIGCLQGINTNSKIGMLGIVIPTGCMILNFGYFLPRRNGGISHANVLQA